MEEKNKNKKPKQAPEGTKDKEFVISGGLKLEETTYDEEIERIMVQSVESVPENIRQHVKDRLSLAFNLKTLAELPHLKTKLVKTLPNGMRLGSRWNKIVDFYQHIQQVPV